MLMHLHAKTEAAIRESNDKHFMFSNSKGWEKTPSRWDSSPLRSCLHCKKQSSPTSVVNARGRGTHKKNTHKGLGNQQEACEKALFAKTYKAPHFWLCSSRRVSTRRRAFGDENPYGVAQHRSWALASLHQPYETKSATFTYGDLINMHPTDLSKSRTLLSSITKFFWWKWLKLTIIICVRDAPRGFS